MVITKEFDLLKKGNLLGTLIKKYPSKKEAAFSYRSSNGNHIRHIVRGFYSPKNNHKP